MKLKHAAGIALLSGLSLIAGCGGGSGGGDDSAAAPLLKGFWEDPANTATNATKAIILTNGDAWLLFLDAGLSNRFARMQLATSGNSFSTTTGSGYQYHLDTPASREEASAAGTFTEKGTVSGTLTAATNSTLSMTYNAARSETAASLVDAAKTWIGSYGSSTATMTIATSTGVLSGTSTTGCTYSGTLLPRSADPAFFDVSFTENCPTANPATIKDLSGIGILNITKTALSIAATTADKTSGALFVGTVPQ